MSVDYRMFSGIHSCYNSRHKNTMFSLLTVGGFNGWITILTVLLTSVVPTLTCGGGLNSLNMKSIGIQNHKNFVHRKNLGLLCSRVDTKCGTPAGPPFGPHLYPFWTPSGPPFGPPPRTPFEPLSGPPYR